jgi:hypothetical protein
MRCALAEQSFVNALDLGWAAHVMNFYGHRPIVESQCLVAFSVSEVQIISYAACWLFSGPPFSAT